MPINYMKIAIAGSVIWLITGIIAFIVSKLI